MLDGIYGIICIKDTYVVCKYVQKTVLELVFRYLPAAFEAFLLCFCASRLVSRARLSSASLCRLLCVCIYVCITIIDTIILTNYTYDAYIYSYLQSVLVLPLSLAVRLDACYALLWRWAINRPPL
jgi:accessory gene regulator protein AgrB